MAGGGNRGGNIRRFAASVLLASLLVPVLARAHHGGVSLAFGPGSPIETNFPLTLPKGGVSLSLRAEQAAWRTFGFAEPENKTSFSFFNVGASYGVTPWLTVTGGNILYLTPGARFSLPKAGNANLGLAVKIPVWKDLNEQGEQQGAEGLEKYRVIGTLSFFF